MAMEVWNEIQKTEAKARQMIEDAKAQRVEIIRNARENSIKMIQKAEAEAAQKGEVILKTKSDEVSKWQEKVAKDVDAEIAKLTQMGDAKLGEAVNLIIEKVVS